MKEEIKEKMIEEFYNEYWVKELKRQGMSDLILNEISGFWIKKLSQRKQKLIEKILDDTQETNEDVWTGKEIREYLKQELTK